MICRDSAGNRKNFTCPSHGWTFSNAGKLLDQSARYGYAEGFAAGGTHDSADERRISMRSGFWFVSVHETDSGTRKTIDALAGGMDVVERRQTMPVLADVLVAARDGRLSVTATDLEVEQLQSRCYTAR